MVVLPDHKTHKTAKERVTNELKLNSKGAIAENWSFRFREVLFWGFVRYYLFSKPKLGNMNDQCSLGGEL